MKKFILLFLLLIILCSSLSFAQDPNNDPTWNWLQQTYTLYTKDQQNGITVLSPFFQGAIGEGIQDSEPEEGWVLLMRDFGLPGLDYRKQDLPFFIIYNTHQGLLRVFVFTIMNEDYSQGNITLQWGTEVTTSALNYIVNTAWGENERDSTMKNASFAIMQPAVNTWAYADFPIAYDYNTPNISEAKAYFVVHGSKTQTVSLSIKGSINQYFGASQTANVAHKGLFGSGGTLDALYKNVQGVQGTFLGLKSTISKVTEGIDTNKTKSKALKNLKIGLGSFLNSWTLSNFGAIGIAAGVFDFFIGGGRSTTSQNQSPMNFQTNLTAEGTIETINKIGSGITLPLPGTIRTSTTPTNLLYNYPLGVLNIRNTPRLNYRDYYKMTGIVGRHVYSFQLKDQLIFDVNPQAEVDIEDLKAALVFTPVSDATGPELLGYVDQGYSGFDNAPILLEGANDNKYTFSTGWTHAGAAKGLAITIPVEVTNNGFYITPGDGWIPGVGNPGNPGEFTVVGKVYLKIKGTLRLKNGHTSKQPLIFIATYNAILDNDDGVDAAFPQPPKAFKIVTSNEYEFDPPDNQSTVYKYNTSQITISAQLNVTKNGRDYVFVGWSDGVKDLTRIVTGDINVKAKYKAHMRTSVANNFSSSTRPQYVVDYTNPNSPDKPSYLVYESNGKIWMTVGKNNSSYGNEVLVSDDYDVYSVDFTAKKPCVALSDDGHGFLGIVYQIVSEWGDTDIMFKVFRDNECIYETPLYDYEIDANNDATPVICSHSTVFTIVYKPTATSLLKEVYYALNNSGSQYYYNKGTTTTLTFTSTASKNPALAHSWALNAYCLVYQNNNTEVVYAEYNGNTASYQTIISASSGYTYNYNPGIKLVDLGRPLVYWAARNMYPSILIKKKNATGWTTTFSTGGFTDNPTCGAANNYDGAVFAWYNSYAAQAMQYIKRFPSAYPSTGYSPSYSLSSFKVTPHLTDGYVLQDVVGVGLRNISDGGSPYLMQSLNYNFYTNALTKEGEIEIPTTYGRSIVVNKEGVEHVFYLGDIKVNGEDVKFIARPDSININSAVEASRAMTTNHFEINGKDNIELRYYNYVIHKELKDSLNANEYVQFRLEAVNKQNGNSAVLKTIRITKDNLQDSTDEIITVNTDNLPSGAYEFRVITDVQGKAIYSLTDHQNTPFEDGLMKKQTFDLAAEMELPSVYALSQNYPNPFNPSTIINYDLPEDSRVTLKVYDILGREITTLVNEYKQAGRYNVTFNASQLATGIYIYELRANDYVSVKKMSFVK